MTDQTEGVERPTPTEEESRRRYIRGELDKLGSDPQWSNKLKIHGEVGETFWLNITPAQQAAIEKILLPEPDTSISVYLLGDEDGPDLFGIIYDTEEEAEEPAADNEQVVWRVPMLPLLDRIERVSDE